MYCTSTQYTPQRYTWSLPPTCFKISANPFLGITNANDYLQFNMRSEAGLKGQSYCGHEWFPHFQLQIVRRCHLIYILLTGLLDCILSQLFLQFCYRLIESLQLADLACFKVNL